MSQRNDNQPQQPAASSAATPTWQPCEPGQLTDIGAATRKQSGVRRIRSVAVSAVTAAVLLLGLAVWGPWSDGDAPSQARKLQCHEVEPLLASYHDGNLDHATREQVEAHLAICPHCQRAYEDLKTRRGAQRPAGQRSIAAVLPLVLPNWLVNGSPSTMPM